MLKTDGGLSATSAGKRKQIQADETITTLKMSSLLSGTSDVTQAAVTLNMKIE